jgi:allantoicase
MADGWETRRRRGPGNDWAIVRLAASGTIERVEVDTSHFKGNAPGRIAIEGVHAPGKAAKDLDGWHTLLESKSEPHRKHIFDHELRRIGPVTHLRISVFPCGGIARFRAWGNMAPDLPKGLIALNATTVDDAKAAFKRCCGSTKWSDAMTAQRPFEDVPSLMRVGERLWWTLAEADHKEAFAAHPKIGAQSPPKSDDPETTGRWSKDEQKATAIAPSSTLAELADANIAYERKNGFIFIVCATGRSTEAMLEDLRKRLARTPAEELRTAAEEQAKITRLRLAKLIGELG